MSPRILKLSLFLVIFVFTVPTVDASDPEWVDAMRAVHSKNRGEKGIFLQLGDSLTYSTAYFSPLEFADIASMPPATREALNVVNNYMVRECYSWKGAEKGNFSGMMTSWGLENIDKWIAELKPETVSIMFGSNDLLHGSIENHEKMLHDLVQKCLDKGVVVILNTIPPIHGFDEKIQKVVEMQRKVAFDMKVPLIDFYAHIIQRRPNDWDGSLPQFAEFTQWETPTLTSRDGIHLSNPKAWQQDYAEDGLRHNGNVLRTWLTLMAYAEVINVVVKGESPSAISTTILGANPLNSKTLFTEQ
jgi:lysophospholipase L1-like esterase